MVQFAVDLIDQLGLIGAAALIAIEVVILPIPVSYTHLTLPTKLEV